VRLPAAREWPGIAGLAVVGLVVYHLALNTGERTTTAGSASLLIATVPLFTALFAMPVTGERQHPAQLVGLGVGFAGAAVIALGERGGLRADRGALLVLLAAAATAAYFAWQKPYLRRCQPAALLAVTIWIATVVLLPWLPAWIGQLRAAPATATVALAFLGVVPTAIAYLAWSWALARRSATLTASSLYVLPALAIGIAWLWLGEVPRPMALAGGALALVGVAITQLGARPPGTPADPPAMPATPCVSGARVTDMERGHDRAQIPAHGRT
jgi:drug/metabolite transporter (DMT)-like permease